MKKVMLIAAIAVASSFTLQAKEKYKIEIRVLDGKALFMPFAKKRVNNLLPEWVALSYVPFNSREQALDRIEMEKARERVNREYKKVTYIYIH